VREKIADMGGEVRRIRDQGSGIRDQRSEIRKRELLDGW
jgi:hypothetical protein